MRRRPRVGEGQRTVYRVMDTPHMLCIHPSVSVDASSKHFSLIIAAGNRSLPSAI